MVRDAVVGIDVGTTFVKSVVFSHDLQTLATAKVRTPWSRTETGAEADPQTLAYAAMTSVSQALAGCPEVTKVVAAGVTSMGETGVLSDRTGRPLAPAIAWHDRRGEREAADLAAAVPHFDERAGRQPNTLPSLVKWRWLLNRGVSAGEVARWDSVAEWIVRSMGGRPDTDLSLASRTGALDVRHGTIDDDGVAWAGASSGWLGPLVPSGHPAGTASGGPPQLNGARLVVAGLDCYASALALDAGTPDTTLLSCGTSGSAIRVLDVWPDRDTMRRGVASEFTVDRFLDGVRPVALGATPCGLILQPLFDLLGPPPSAQPDSLVAPGGHLSATEMWQRAFEAVADGEARLVRDIRMFGEGLGRVVAAGGWIAEADLREGLERRLGPVLTVDADETTAARGAALLALRAL